MKGISLLTTVGSRLLLWTSLSLYFFIPFFFWLSYLPTPPLGQDMTQGQFFKRSLTGFNSEFSFSKTCCLNKAEEPSLSYYLPIAEGRIIGFIPFPGVLVLCEMQSVSPRIKTHVAASISCEDNHYTTDIFTFFLVIILSLSECMLFFLP